MLCLYLAQLLVQPGGQVTLQRDVPDGLLALDGDPLAQRAPIHPVQTFTALHGKALLHRLIEIKELVLGPALQMGDLGVQLAVACVDVAHEVALVPLQLLLKLVEGRTAVAGIALPRRPLLDVAGQVQEVLLPGTERIIRYGIYTKIELYFITCSIDWWQKQSWARDNTPATT